MKANWNLDVTTKAKYYIVDIIVGLNCNMIGSNIRSTGINNVRGEAHIVYDPNDVAIDFVSNFTFDLNFVVTIEGSHEVVGKVALSDAMLSKIQSVDCEAFQFTWHGYPSGFYFHQSKSMFQSQRCRTALAALYSDYVDYCHTHFLNMDSESLEVESQCFSLENTYQSLPSLETAQILPQVEKDTDEINFDIE